MSFSVVIPSARAENLVACVEALRACEPELTPDRIIVVDDGARARAESLLGPLTWVPGDKPFVFARNANLGIVACQGDVILLNDDAELVTPHGFSSWSELMAGEPKLAVCSAGIRGVVGNRRQRAASNRRLDREPAGLAFVCVYLPRNAIDVLGLLDERYTGYGFDDNDYCERALAAGWELGIWHGCVVNHDGKLPSTFRTRPDIRQMFENNRRIHRNKHAASAAHRRAESRASAGVADGSATAVQTQTDGLRLNIGWCGDPIRGFTNVSLGGLDSDDAVDLSGAWPWEDGSASEVRAWNVVEHLHDKIRTMNELWRILRDGGTAELVLPTTDGNSAFQDPTQVSYWNRRSFLYYEEGSPYRERFAARYGIQARFRVVTERVEPTGDGPVLFITLRAVKGHVDDPERTPRPRQVAVEGATSRPEFICAMRVKNEAEHIREAIESVLPLCERVVLFDDHSTDATVAIARSFGERCTILHSPYQGLHEARDKNHVLEHLIQLDPAWVLWIDGDEVLERSGPEALRAAATARRTAAYSLRIAYLWDDPGQVRVDGLYGAFRRFSFFRLRGQDTSGLRFAPTKAGGSFHCGNVPGGLSGASRSLPIRLKHYGYLTSERREEKYRFYTTMDPDNSLADNYRHIVGIPGARYAPGRPVFVPWCDDQPRTTPSGWKPSRSPVNARSSKPRSVLRRR